ncbi:MAG: hypothetical protein J5972_03245 [Eubacterium sp.]|nr:hypothetical protein [Eubacterium sp.]
MKESTQTWKTIVRYGISFLLVAALCWLFPYSGDDWAWGSQIGIDRLNVWFYKYNGRYVGNLIVLAMTRSNLLKAVVMSIGLVGTAFLTEKIFKKTWSYYFCLVTLILMPKLLLRQAVVWTSGYANYVTSLFFTLIYIAYVYPLFQNKDKKYPAWHVIPMFLLAVINTLIVEHMTIYNVILAIAVVIYTIVFYKKAFVAHIAYLIGSIVGTYYMFANGAYSAISSGEDPYRQVAENGLLDRAIKNYKDVIVKHLCLNNLWINVAIFVVCLILFWQLKNRVKSSKYVMCMRCMLYFMGFYNIWALLSVVGISTWTKQALMIRSEAILTTLYMGALIAYSILAAIQMKKLWQTLFWNASIVGIAAPLLVVDPIGERCFFPTYIMFMLLCVELMTMIDLQQVVGVINGKTFCRVCVLFCIAGLAFYFNIFSSIHTVDQKRLERIQKEVKQGKTSVEIRHLPYESYIWTATPEREPWIERYKAFHGIPENIELKHVWHYTPKKKK